MESEIELIKKEYPLESIKKIISKFKSLKVLVIGESIIDDYNFVVPKGRATKDPILSVDYIRSEAYAGGILAIANHISNFADEVMCITAIGDRNNRREFIEGALNKNIKIKFITKQDSPTITKMRYLDIHRNEKLFKVEYINDAPISAEIEQELLEFLKSELPKYDLTVVGDFGHGLITDKIIDMMEEKANFLSVNVQSNSANLGFNYATKYNSPDYLTMDAQELRYAVSDRFSEIPVLMKKLSDKKRFNRFLVTMSKKGSGYFSSGKLSFFPAFVMRPHDTVGAGDAVFSITSLFACCNCDSIIPFIANCAGGIAVSYIGNKESITKEGLLSFIEEVYRGDKKTLSGKE